MPITLLQSSAPPAPSAGKASVFIDASDGIPKYVDESGVVRILGAGVPGDQGDKGDPGTNGKDGQIRFTGTGSPPAYISGAEPGDTYLDLLTGDVYTLN